MAEHRRPREVPPVPRNILERPRAGAFSGGAAVARFRAPVPRSATGNCHGRSLLLGPNSCTSSRKTCCLRASQASGSRNNAVTRMRISGARDRISAGSARRAFAYSLRLRTRGAAPFVDARPRGRRPRAGLLPRQKTRISSYTRRILGVPGSAEVSDLLHPVQPFILMAVGALRRRLRLFFACLPVVIGPLHTKACPRTVCAKLGGGLVRPEKRRGLHYSTAGATRLFEDERLP